MLINYRVITGVFYEIKYEVKLRNHSTFFYCGMRSPSRVLNPGGAIKKLVCFQPVLAGSYFYFYRNGYWKSVTHRLEDKGFDDVHFIAMCIKYQFIMHLEDHAGAELMSLEGFMHGYHGKLDHISGSALYGHVDGVAFSITPYYRIGRVDVFQPAFAAQHRLYIAMLLRKLYLVLHV